MHTFDLTCSINESMFRRLLNIPGMKQVSEKACKTFYYSSKGFNEITLYVYRFKDKSCGSMVERYYLFLRCNISVIMGESKTFALNLDGYTLSGLVNGIQKRFYEVNEFRFLNLHKMDIALWRTDRVDIAADVCVENPELLVYMLNMAFPKKFHMKPYENSKGGVQKTESCYFKSKSRRINIYRKLPEMETHGAVPVEERETLGSLVRVEIQVGKRAIYNMKGLPEDKRNLENFLNPDFTRSYLEKNVRDIFGSVKFVSMTTAIDIINKSGYRTETKMVLCSVIRQIRQYGSLYELQRCIEDVNSFTPTAYGDKTKFKRLLKKITDLGIHPATIPDESAVGSSLEVPSLYGLLQQARKG